MTKVNRYNGQQRRTQNLAQRKNQHKHLEVGQTLTQPTGDPKLKETTGTIDFSQPKPVVTNPQVQPSADDIALLNQQNTLAEQNRKIEEIKKQIESDEKKLAQMNRDENPGKYDDKARKIKDKKAKLTKLYDDRAGIETKIEKTKNNILKANEPAPAGDPLAVKKSQTTPQKETILGDSKNQSVAEAPKTEVPKAEAPKAEAPKSEVPTAEAPKTEAPNVEAPKAETPKVKSKGGFFSKIGNFFKGKKLGKGGKIAIGVAAVATVAAGAYAIFGGSDDKKGSNVQPETAPKAEQQKTPAPADTATVAADSTATPKDTVATNLDQALVLADEAKAKEKEKEKEIEKAEKKAEDKKAEKSKKEEQAKETAKADTTATKKVKPAAANVEKQDTVKNDTTKVAGQANANIAVPENTSKVAPQAQANKSQEVNNREKAQPAQDAQATKQTDKQVDQEIKEWVAQNGENYWNYAKRELIFEHQGQAGYRPSNKEIADRMLEVMKRNGVDFAADGIHSNPMLKIGDKVKVLFEEKAA